MPGGRRRQLLLDLAARIVDTPDLQVNLVIVSSWARTGWNIVTPNVLIDATATRDATAWQQLRGRAMRPALTWSSTAQRLVQHLLACASDDGLSDGLVGPTPGTTMPDLAGDEAGVLAQLRIGYGTRGPRELAVSVMLALNKVTHVYELLRAHGSRPQVAYDRRGSAWERSPLIATKHFREAGVRARDGAYLLGPTHAPLVVAADPRTDLPAAFQARLTAELAGADARLVRGWVAATAPTGDVLVPAGAVDRAAA